MTQQQFFQELDCCYAQLNQVTIETTISFNLGTVITSVKKPKPVTQEDVEKVKKELRRLLSIAIANGWYK